MMNGPLQPIRFDVARFLAYNGYAETIDLDRVPERYRRAMRDYLGHGAMPEVPLRLLLEGQLLAVRFFRDDLPGMQALVDWLFAVLPSVCWGSPDQVQTWVTFTRRRDQEKGQSRRG